MQAINKQQKKKPKEHATCRPAYLVRTPTRKVYIPIMKVQFNISNSMS